MHSPILFAVSNKENLYEVLDYISEGGTPAGLCKAEERIQDWLTHKSDFWDVERCNGANAAIDCINELSQFFDIEYSNGYAKLMQKPNAMTEQVRGITSAMGIVRTAMAELNTIDLYDIIMDTTLATSEERSAATLIKNWAEPHAGTCIIMIHDGYIIDVLRQGKDIVNTMYREFYVFTDFLGDYHTTDDAQ